MILEARERLFVGTILLLVLPCITGAQATSPAPGRSCRLAGSCSSMSASIPDCPLLQDTRSCTLALNIVVKTIEVHDAACEAAKATQNQLYASQKLACESSKSAAQAGLNKCLSVATACSAVLNEPGTAKINGLRLLWVGTYRPDESAYERQALAELGAEVVPVNGSQEALMRLKDRREKFGAIISGPLGSEGGVFFKGVRKLSHPPPIIIYNPHLPSWVPKSTSPVPEATQPRELFELVVGSLNDGPDR